MHGTMMHVTLGDMYVSNSLTSTCFIYLAQLLELQRKQELACENNLFHNSQSFIFE